MIEENELFECMLCGKEMDYEGVDTDGMCYECYAISIVEE